MTHLLDAEANMQNLQPIHPNPGRPLRCVQCGQWRAVFADLNGEPFKAYYCTECAAKAAA